MRELLGRTLQDVALVLESPRGSDHRILRVLELLRRVVPYEQCALFAALSGREPRLLVVPATPPNEQATLSETLASLHRRLVDERANPLEARARPWGSHLAVPVVGNDQAIGVLFVSAASSEGSDGGYTEHHLRELSIVGAHVAGYLVMVDQARALDEARREAEAANRMKDEFLALVSHELKTPLTSILAWTHMLRLQEPDLSGRTRAVDAIEQNVHAQAKLIDEILDLACIAAADLRLDLESIEPASLIEAALNEQRLAAERRSIRLETALDESITELVVDPVRMVQVISNLIAKAIQFTPNGGNVGVRLESAGGHARIRVTDDGKGIPPEALPRMFERARAAQNYRSRAFGELGAGLSVVKTLVEAHGGHVRAESSGDDKGSTFTVDLPLPPQAPPALGRRLLAGIRVLLVDDDDDMRTAVGGVLEYQGAQVTAVGSAGAALEALEHSRPHVLLSDLSLPGQSGYDLMRKVAARDASLPAAALTACRGEEHRRCALEAGFRMHLQKPLDVRALVAAVAILTGRPLAKGSRAVIGTAV